MGKVVGVSCRTCGCSLLCLCLLTPFAMSLLFVPFSLFGQEVTESAPNSQTSSQQGTTTSASKTPPAPAHKRKWSMSSIPKGKTASGKTTTSTAKTATAAPKRALEGRVVSPAVVGGPSRPGELSSNIFK